MKTNKFNNIIILRKIMLNNS